MAAPVSVGSGCLSLWHVVLLAGHLLSWAGVLPHHWQTVACPLWGQATTWSLSRRQMSSYCFSYSAVSWNDLRISSALSPIQYINVFTCVSSSLAVRPDAILNRWNRHSHLGHSSGLVKLKASGATSGHAGAERDLCLVSSRCCTTCVL